MRLARATLEQSPVQLACWRRCGALAGGALPLQTPEQKAGVLALAPMSAAPPAMAPLPSTKRPALPLEPPEGSIAPDSSDKTLRLWSVFAAKDLIDWTLANRYVPELTADQKQRYGPALAAEEVTPTP
jgi:hypothetical protein